MRRNMSENDKSNNNNAQKSSNHKSGQHKVINRSSRIQKTKSPTAKIGRPPRRPKQ